MMMKKRDDITPSIGASSVRDASSVTPLAIAPSGIINMWSQIPSMTTDGHASSGASQTPQTRIFLPTQHLVKGSSLPYPPPPEMVKTSSSVIQTSSSVSHHDYNIQPMGAHHTSFGHTPQPAHTPVVCTAPAVLTASSVAIPVVTAPKSAIPVPSQSRFASPSSGSTVVGNINSNLLIQSQDAIKATVSSSMSALSSMSAIASVSSGLSAGQTMAINLPPLSCASSQQQQQFQRLKVEDALSYLDQVKFKFNNQPQVYNDFLDIMKEFKSQSIDTPGVIQRVSTLFKGHPELIVGFNTFLPPGYKIEMQSNDQVNVSMPNSTNTILMTSGGTITTGPSIISTPAAHLTSVPPVSNSKTICSGSSALSHQTAINVALAAASNQSRVGTSSTHDAAHQLTAQSQSAINTLMTSANGGSGPGGGSGGGPGGGTAAQPVEFNHAINYVNKIKNRFQGQPEIYKQFLEILHTYQKEQKSIKDGTPIVGQKMLTETEVFSQVAKLFQNQEDLLQEFSQFLPDANGASMNASNLHSITVGMHQSPQVQFGHPLAHHPESIAAAHAANNDHGAIVKKPSVARPNINTQPFHPRIQLKRQTNDQLQHHQGSAKRQKMTSLRDISLAEAGKYGSLTEYAFFDKVRKALRSPEVYENFVRCLVLYNHEILSRTELVQLVTPFLGKYPELLKWFKDFLGYKEGASGNSIANSVNSATGVNHGNHQMLLEGLPHRVAAIRERERERINSDIGMEIDYAACKRYGASYRALPKNYVQPRCTGRTQLCKEVLNDVWVSFPSWSEDSTFVSSRKTQYEEYIYRCEDERFELDVVLETNLATIRVLEAVQKKLSRMPPEERNRFKLDDNLGGTSAVIHQRAIRRIYGDKSQEIIEGLKKNPAVAVPLVIRRLVTKEEEWRDAQKQFNKIWREQNEKYYLKSLDHQGISFKQNDIKFLRSKSLLNEIETIFEERHEQNDQTTAADGSSAANASAVTAQHPHMTFVYKDKSMIEEACNLIIHHVKRQTSTHKDDKQKIKQLLRQLIPDMFATPRSELSDDELEDIDDDIKPNNKLSSNLLAAVATASADIKGETEMKERKANEIKSKTEESIHDHCAIDSNGSNEQKAANIMLNCDPNDCYNLFFVNNNWYLFFRLHHILCERLGKMYDRAMVLAAEEAKEKVDRKESTAVALRLKPNNDVEIEEYFPAFVDMVKQVLDGNLDSNQYEDMLRDMFGIYAYNSFTMDKVVQNIVRQLQHIVCDEICNQCTDLFVDEAKNGATGGPCASAHLRTSAEAAYQKKAEHLLADENCFKIIIYKGEGKLCIEMVDIDTDEDESDGEQMQKWSEYVEKYVREDATITDELKDLLSKKPVFLPRNIRTFRSRRKDEDKDNEDLIRNDLAPKKDHSDGGNDAKSDEQRSRSSQSPSPPRPSGTAAGLESTEVIEGSECKFNVNNFKMVFVVQSESYLYRRNSMKKARMSHKKVSQHLYSKFNDWHMRWLQKSASNDEKLQCQRWLNGDDNERCDTDRDICVKSNDANINNKCSKSSSSASSTFPGKSSTLSSAVFNLSTTKKTVRHVFEFNDRPPYHTFCKYKYEDLK